MRESPRRTITRVDTLTVLRFSALMYLSLFLVVVVAGLVLWVVALVVGAIDNVEDFIEELFALDSFAFEEFAILRGTLVGGLLVVVMGTAFNVLAAVLYNLISEVVGGVQVTVSEDERDAVAADRRDR